METKKAPITAEELKQMVKEAFEARAALDVVKKKKTEMEAQYKEMCNSILFWLEEVELENFKVPGFGNAIVQNKFSVKTPKDPEAKEKLFRYLQGKGHFWEVVSVNSATLNSYYKEQMEEAVEADDFDFAIPGIDEPMHYQQLQMRKG